ncbi:hypothetical protein AAE478_007340 [Parahypoxylon ruwenzoriense]
MSQANNDPHSQCIEDNNMLLVHRGPPSLAGQDFHLSALPEIYSGHGDLSAHSFLPTSIPPFSSNSTFITPPVPSMLMQPPAGVGETSHLSTETALAQHTQQATWSGGAAQSATQTEPFNFQFTAGGTSGSLPEVQPMRYFHTDLAVLSAEEYDNGRYSRRPAAKTNPKPSTAPVDSAPNPKKRARKPSSAEPEEPAAEAKRARGRPRLETQDQTRTERRRTQIRLAQRAYRNRKENAITDLQAKINDLREVNNEINSAYQNLFDYASSRGLLAQAPEFGQQLQRLQNLIKQTEDKETTGDERSSPEGNSDDNQPEAPRVEPQRTEDVSTSTEVPFSTQPEAQSTYLMGGITLSHEPVPVPMIHEGVSTTTTNTANLDPSLSNPQVGEYEIVTAPTLENASFGPNISFDPNFFNPPAWQSSWAQHPWNRLTGPRTMSFNEWAFARRLHRHSVERAAALISMPNPPPTKMTRVFGFVMLFETVDEIRTRTMTTLDRLRHEPLNYWQYPFHRLGGSGTHFSPTGDHAPSSLSGDSPYQSTGFGTGPFNDRTTHVRDTLLGVSQYINMSGWQGTWFDSGEVETYLAQNGIVIPTAADIHPIEVPPGAFADVTALHHMEPMQTIPPNATPAPGGNPPFNHGMSAPGGPPMGGADMSFSAGSDAHGGTVRNDLWPPIPVTSNLGGAAQTAGVGAPSFTGFDNMAANTFPSGPSYLFPRHEQPATTASPAMPAAKRVLLDVNGFIDGLISNATCLGRAPAFRPKDIASAFWGAVITDVHP